LSQLTGLSCPWWCESLGDTVWPLDLARDGPSRRSAAVGAGRGWRLAGPLRGQRQRV